MESLINDMDESRNKAQTYYRQGRWLDSIKYAKQWLSFAKGDQTEEAAAYDILANSFNKIAEWKESIENGNHELRIAKEMADMKLEAQARSILSSSYYRDNNYEQSIEHCNQILRIPEGNKQRKWDVQAYNNLALSYYMLQNGVEDPDYNESIKYGELQLKAAKELGDGEGQMAAYFNLFNSYTKSGDEKKAKYSQLQQRALQDQLQSKAAAAGGFPNYSSESPQDGEHEKERSNSGDFQEINEGETNEARERLPNGSSSVPSEVESRGPGANVASENDLNTRKVKLYRARIILIGQDQAGKTSLKKSLFGLPFESEEESTEGIKGDPTVFEVEVKQVKNWLLSDDARITAEEVQEEEPKEIEMNAGPTREDKTESVTPELKIDPAIPPEELTDVLVQHLRGLNLQSDATSVENHTTLDVWDFVGQHLYYAIYPVFLSPKAIYMLICNLSKDLKATVPPCARKTVFESNVQNENSETNLDNLLSWLTSVSTLCPTKTDATKKLDYLCPPIFIVGTHADKPHEDIKKMEEQIQKEIFDNKFGDHVVSPFFSVDNTQGSSGEGLAELRKRMNEVLMEQPYMGEEVPLRWLGFEKVVQAMVAVKVYYLKLEQLQTIIQKVCSIEDENEVATMLDFYHDLGVIVKHRNTVVLQAQWLIGIFKQLIALPSFKEMKPKHSKLWRDLGDKGVLSRTLVDHVFRKLCPIKEDILDMMEQFGLIAKFATSSIDENYFVPCQLKTPPAHIFTMKPTPSDPFPLYLHFELGFVPHGFFSQLVSTFTRSGFKSGFKEGFTMSPYFYDKVSKFVIEKKFRHHLVMLCTKGIIKIVLNRESPECSESSAEIEEVANTVRQSLENAIQSLTSKIPWLKDLKTDWCAACPNKYRNSDCLSLRKILEGGKLKYCEECHIVETVILPQLEKWFSMKATGPTKKSFRPASAPVTRASPATTTKLSNRTFQQTDEAPPTKTTLSTRTFQKPAAAPGRYKMTANPKGITLIINNKEFLDEKHRTRHGAEKDVYKVKKLFTSLGFKVDTKEDLSTQALKTELDSVACQDHSDYDCFVLWLMSHGESGKVYCTESVALPIQTAHDLLSNCKTLMGKPKLFFIQACRGEAEDAIDSSDAVGTPSTAVKAVPSNADFLYSYSTVNEHASYRNPENGSYYVNALVEAFNERVPRDHLINILTVANEKVSKMFPTSPYLKKKVKTISEFSSTLRKEVWFSFKQ